jgi:hypothetical protein
MSFHYEFPSPFYLLIFQVSDMRYKAVRTENTHLKGMMGDLDPGRYMVICWIHSLNWARDYLIGQDFPKHCLLSTCHISGMQELQTILHSVEFTFILRLEHLISSFLPSSVSWIELNSDHLPDTFFRCFQSCCCLEILPHTWYILQLTQILCFSFPLFNVTVDGWFFSLHCCARWRYMLAFTLVLRMHQIYMICVHYFCNYPLLPSFPNTFPSHWCQPYDSCYVLNNWNISIIYLLFAVRENPKIIFLLLKK